MAFDGVSKSLFVVDEVDGTPILGEVRVLGAPASWEGHVLQARIVAGSGAPLLDMLRIAERGGIQLGRRIEVNLENEVIGEAQEVLWHGARFGLLETEWDLALGGEKLLPLTVALEAGATDEAVEGLVRALRYLGPGERRVAVWIRGADGEEGLRTEVLR